MPHASRLRDITPEHLGQAADAQDVYAFRVTARLAMRVLGLSEADAVDWTWNDGKIRDEDAVYAAAIGRRGRAVNSPGQRAASRENGKKGGRPARRKK